MSLYRMTNYSQALLDGDRAATYLTEETRKELLLGAASEITGRYYELAADLVSVVSYRTTVLIFLKTLKFLDHLL